MERIMQIPPSSANGRLHPGADDAVQGATVNECDLGIFYAVTQ